MSNTVNETLYDYYKDKYKRTRYPLIDEQQFDALVADIRAESAERIKVLEETISKMATTTPKWISIKTNPPAVNEGTFAILYENGLPGIGCIGVDKVIEPVGNSANLQVTHWMPLPPKTNYDKLQSHRKIIKDKQ